VSGNCAKALLPQAAFARPRGTAAMSVRHLGGPLMGWSGRAPAPPAISWPGAPRQGARHVSDTQYRDRRDRDRLRSGHFRSECMRIMGGGTSVVASATGNVGRQASATKSSASNTPPTQRKYRARGICNSTPRFGRCSEMRHRSAMTSGLSDRTALTHRPPEGCHPSFFKEDAPYSLWP